MKKPRKPRWWEPQHLTVRPDYRGQPTGFEDDTLLDYAFWLTDEESHDPTLRAIINADRLGDPQPIIDLLKSGRPISNWGHRLIADYMERNRKGKRGPKATPIYARSLEEAKRMLALDSARLLMTQGQSKDDAFAKAAREQGINPETLHSFVAHKLGSSRRMRTRRSSAPKSRK